LEALPYYKCMEVNSVSCTVVACSNKLVARGLCGKHYQQLPEQVAKRKLKSKTSEYREYSRKQKAEYQKSLTYKGYQKRYHSDPKNKNRRKAKYHSPGSRAKRVADRLNPELVQKERERVSSIGFAFNRAKNAAKYRKLCWSISLELFTQLRACSCVYCGFQLPKTGSCLDRIDNRDGYQPHNVVPCCTECNLTRGDMYTHQEMRILGESIRALKLARDDSNQEQGRHAQ
jgi:hypothetical protein